MHVVDYMIEIFPVSLNPLLLPKRQTKEKKYTTHYHQIWNLLFFVHPIFLYLTLDGCSRYDQNMIEVELPRDSPVWLSDTVFIDTESLFGEIYNELGIIYNDSYNSSFCVCLVVWVQ